MLRLGMVATALALVSSVALAADLPRPMVTKAPPVPVATGIGCYLGANGGGAIVRHSVDVAVEELLTVPGTGNLNPSGGFAGGTLGCGQFFGSFYLGVEADVDYDFTKQTVPLVLGTANVTLKSGFFADQFVKIGVPLGTQANFIQANSANWPIPIALPTSASLANIMPWLGAGVAERDFRGCLAMVTVGAACGSDFLVGFAATGGLHIPVAASFAIDVQYEHVFWNKTFAPVGSPFEGVTANFHITGEDIGLVKAMFYF